MCIPLPSAHTTLARIERDETVFQHALDLLLHRFSGHAQTPANGFTAQAMNTAEQDHLPLLDRQALEHAQQHSEALLACNDALGIEIGQQFACVAFELTGGIALALQATVVIKDHVLSGFQQKRAWVLNKAGVSLGSQLQKHSLHNVFGFGRARAKLAPDEFDNVTAIAQVERGQRIRWRWKTQYLSRLLLSVAAHVS